MILLRMAVLSLIVIATQAFAQADKPGPMQSGIHVQSDAAKAPAGNPSAPAASGQAADFDPVKLFATTCGWCHLDGGRVAGKGPQLMNTERTDAEIVSRIRNGKQGQMPAFGSTFNEDQLKAIVAYIRGLKP